MKQNARQQARLLVELVELELVAVRVWAGTHKITPDNKPM